MTDMDAASVSDADLSNFPASKGEPGISGVIGPL